MTIWTLELDAALETAVKRLSAAGFNRLEKNAPRIAGTRNSWALGFFWEAVAASLVVQCGIIDGFPSPNACKARWWDLLDELTDPSKPERRTSVAPGVTADLKRYDNEWEHAAVMCLEDQERTIADLSDKLTKAQIALHGAVDAYNASRSALKSIINTATDAVACHDDREE